MKQYLALLFAAILALSSLCALSEETLSSEMARVTLLVKEQLDLPDDYSEFSGSLNDGCWTLSWSGENRWAEVSCSRDGLVFSFYRYDDQERPNAQSGLGARFPKLDAPALSQAADAFLAKVIDTRRWGWQLDALKPSLVHSFRDQFSAVGHLTLDGYPTDISITLGIDCDSGRVNSYYRSDAHQQYAPIPDQPETSMIDEAAGRQTLQAAYTMEAEYLVVTDGEPARLVYTLKPRGLLAVDVKTGLLLNEQPVVVYSATEEAEDEDSAAGALMSKRQLTQTELDSIAHYDGVLSRSALDAAVREIPELKLGDSDLLTSVSYQVSEEKPQANLNYTRELEGVQLYRHLLVDAQSGKLLYAWTSVTRYTSFDEDALIDAQKEAAQRFIERYLPELSDDLSLTSESAQQPMLGEEVTGRFVFTRTHEGYPFKANSLTLRTGADGTLWDYSLSWDEEQAFAPLGEKLIGEAEAARLWIGDAPLELGYVTTTASGESKLTLCWRFKHTDGIYAVDAFDASRYTSKLASDGSYTYPETEMLYDSEVRRLGAFGVGLAGCGFTSKDTLTGDQLMHLLLQAEGYESGEAFEGDELKNSFKKRFGTLPEADENGAVSRGELMRVMVCAAGYANAARLTGIYTSDALDFAALPEEQKGSAAIAGALGVIDLEDGCFNASQPALSAQAAHAVYVLLSK